MAPSCVAASVIYCARLCMAVSPTWTPRLKALTHGRNPSDSNMLFCVGKLLTAYKQALGPAGLKVKLANGCDFKAVTT